MSYFADAQEVYGTLGRMLEIAGADADLGMQQADTVVRSVYSEPDSVITISLRPGETRVDFGDSDLGAGDRHVDAGGRRPSLLAR